MFEILNKLTGRRKVGANLVWNTDLVRNLLDQDFWGYGNLAVIHIQ